MKTPSVRNSKLLNVWQWHESDNTGDAIMFWGVEGGVIENNTIVNDLKTTRWVGRIGVVLETATSDVLIKNNVISGYSRNVHIENTYGGHQIIGNKLLASDVGVVLNEPDALHPPPQRAFIKPDIIKNNYIRYDQERERYGIHPFGGPRSFISISGPRSEALSGTQLIGNTFIYDVHQGVKVNEWRKWMVKEKSRMIYVTPYPIKGWVEYGNVFK